MSKKTEETALAVIEKKFEVLAGVGDLSERIQDVREMIGDMDGSIIPRYVSTMDGMWKSEDGETLRDAEVIILHMTPGRRYFTGSFDSKEAQFPSCTNFGDRDEDDDLVGTGVPGGKCKLCEYNAFGTDERGTGKACKQYLYVLAAMAGSGFPVVFQVPPTGLKQFRNLIGRQRLAKGRRPGEYTVATGTADGAVSFAVCEVLSEDAVAQVAKLQEATEPMWMDYLRWMQSAPEAAVETAEDERIE